MTRSVKKWVGKTPDSVAPPRVRLRVFEKHKGVCHISGRKITPADKWDLDHVVALVNGGANDEDNLAPALRSAHRKKTAEDVATKAKDRRVRAKHLGLHQPKQPMPGSRGSKFKRKIGGGTVLREEDT